MFAVHGGGFRRVIDKIIIWGHEWMLQQHLRGPPLRRVLDEAAAQEILPLLRQLARDLRQLIAEPDPVEQFPRVSATWTPPRRPTGHHLRHRASHRPDVRRGPALAPRRRFGRHVQRRASDSAAGAGAAVNLVSDPLCEAEIRDFDVSTAAVDQYVLQFDVAVRVTAGVHAVQSPEDRARVSPHGRLPERAAGAAEQVVKGAPGDELQEQVVGRRPGGGVRGDLFAEAADDVRAVLEVRQDGLLFPEEGGAREGRGLHGHQRWELPMFVLASDEGQADSAEAAAADHGSSGPLHALSLSLSPLPLPLLDGFGPQQ